MPLSALVAPPANERGRALLHIVVVAVLAGCHPAARAVETPAHPASPASAAVEDEPATECRAVAPSSGLRGQAPERWVRVEREAIARVGDTRRAAWSSEVEPPIPALLWAEDRDCVQAAYVGPTWELYFAVVARDLVPVITARTRVDAGGDPPSAAEDGGLWLAPGAPVVIDFAGERPRVSLRARGIEASGTVDPAVVGRTYQPDPFVRDGKPGKALAFDAAMPLFAGPDRGAFAVLDARVGVMPIGDEGRDHLPVTYVLDFTTEEIGRSGDWVQVVVRADDGSYELRGITPSFAVRPQSGVIMGTSGPGSIRLRAGTRLRDREGNVIATTTAAGRYRGDKAGKILLETPWGDLEVWVEVMDPRSRSR